MTIKEEWRPVEGFEGLYEVSSYGRVRGLDRYVKTCYGSYRLQKGKVLSPGKYKDGYLVVSLQGRSFRIHRLVAQAFIPNPDNLPQINHKDEDKTNNNVTNLEWCDSKYNLNYGSRIERHRNTMLEKGYWSGLSKKEYNKEYYEKYKEKIKEYNKEYNKKYKDKNKDKIKEYNKEYYEKNKEYYRSYYIRHREEILEKMKKK